MQPFNPSTSSASKWKVSYLARQLTEELARNHSIPFVVLTETWLKSHIEDAQVEIPGYNLFRSDRSSRVGGGVLLYSHEKLPITQVKTYDDQICQALICKCESTKSIVFTLYRPPAGSVFSFRSCLKFIDDYIADDRDDHELSLFGDFNLPLINWSTNKISSGGAVATTEAAALLLDFMAENLCCQYVSSPTRVNNVLDLCITNSEELISHVSTSDTILSDHRLVEIFWSFNPCSFTSPNPPVFVESSFRSLDFFKADYSAISNMIESVDWETSDQENFPELFTQTVLTVCKICCPRKIPPKSKPKSLIRVPSRKKRKLQTELHAAENDALCPEASLKSL